MYVLVKIIQKIILFREMGIPEELPHTMASWKFRGTMPPTSLHDVKISNTGQQIREPSMDGTDGIPVIAKDISFTFDSRNMIYLKSFEKDTFNCVLKKVLILSLSDL